MKQEDGILAHTHLTLYKPRALKALIISSKRWTRVKKVKHLSGKEVWLCLSGFGAGVEVLWFPREFVTISLHLKSQIFTTCLKKPYDKEIKTYFKPLLHLWLPAGETIKPTLDRCSYNPSHKFWWRKKALKHDSSHSESVDRTNGRKTDQTKMTKNHKGMK